MNHWLIKAEVFSSDAARVMIHENSVASFLQSLLAISSLVRFMICRASLLLFAEWLRGRRFGPN